MREEPLSMGLNSMVQRPAWPIEEHIWHVARGRDDRWKVFQEGAPTAESRHESRDEALEAARVLAESDDAAKIKLHEPDGTLERVLRPDRL